MFRFMLALIVAAAAVGLVGGCAPGDGAGVGETAEGPTTVAVTVPGWRLEEGVTVGGPGAPEREMLFAVPAVAEGERGEFHVLNTGHNTVLSFDSAGRYLRTIGREGYGPGEFAAPGAIVSTTGDALFVLDAQAERISRFRGSDGEFVAAVPLRGAPGAPMRMEPGPEGTLVVEFAGVGASPRPVLAGVNTSTGEIRPLAELDTAPQIPVTGTMDGKRVTRFIRAPFAPAPAWSSDRRGAVLFGKGTEFAIYRSTGSGVALAFRAKAKRESVTERDRALFFENRPDLKSFGREIPFPEEKPFFTDLRFDPEGLLWVRVPTREDRQVWEVRESRGQKRGELFLPWNWRLVGISRGAVYVIENGENGEVLHRYRLVR